MAADDDTLLGFGRHREKTLREAAAMPEYREWALSVLNPKGLLKVFVDYLKEHTPDIPLSPASSNSEDEQPLRARALAKKRVSAQPICSSDTGGDSAKKKDGGVYSEKTTNAVLSTMKVEEPVEAEEPVVTEEQMERGGESESDPDDEKPLRHRARAKPKKRARSEEAPPSDDEEDEIVDKHTIAMAKRMAMAVIARGTRGDAEGVLSVLGVPITNTSPFEGELFPYVRPTSHTLMALTEPFVSNKIRCVLCFTEMRKAYRGLARLLHPDKLGRHFTGATKAFQFLTSAFDTLTAPEPVAEDKRKKKGPTLARSNEGCFRTKVCCPRCSSHWGTPESGLQPYEYTFMMQGLKTYVCCGCLLQFGCMSAVHHCPHCQGEVYYHPKKYHTQAKCMSCKQSFGYRLYTTGPRIEAALRQQLLERAAKRQQKNDSDLSRQQRKPLEVPVEQRAPREEALFRVGLLDACPRCGFQPASDGGEGLGEAERARHLRECTDEAAHAAHAAARQEHAQELSRRARTETRQDEVERLAAHRFLGGGAASAWMLTDKQLAAECKERGLTPSGSREEQLARLASSSTDRAPPLIESIACTLHSLSVDALRSLCASRGITPPVGCSKDKLIHLLEARDGTLEAIGFSVDETAEDEDKSEEEEEWQGEQEELEGQGDQEEADDPEEL